MEYSNHVHRVILELLEKACRSIVHIPVVNREVEQVADFFPKRFFIRRIRCDWHACASTFRMGGWLTEVE
jgi:hypothetical protein